MANVIPVVKKSARMVITPFTAIVGKIYWHAEKQMAFQPPELVREIAAADKEGIDVAWTMERDFVQREASLIWYRIHRMGVEWKYLTKEHCFSCEDISCRNFVREFFFMVRLAFYLCAGVFVGRGTTQPVMYPDSPFVASLEWRNPNQGM